MAFSTPAPGSIAARPKIKAGGVRRQDEDPAAFRARMDGNNATNAAPADQQRSMSGAPMPAAPPTRRDNVVAARADGSFNQKRDTYNAANATTGKSMDEAGNIASNTRPLGTQGAGVANSLPASGSGAPPPSGQLVPGSSPGTSIWKSNTPPAPAAPTAGAPPPTPAAPKPAASAPQPLAIAPPPAPAQSRLDRRQQRPQQTAPTAPAAAPGGTPGQSTAGFANGKATLAPTRAPAPRAGVQPPPPPAAPVAAAPQQPGMAPAPVPQAPMPAPAVAAPAPAAVATPAQVPAAAASSVNGQAAGAARPVAAVPAPQAPMPAPVTAPAAPAPAPAPIAPPPRAPGMVDQGDGRGFQPIAQVTSSLRAAQDARAAVPSSATVPVASAPPPRNGPPPLTAAQNATANQQRVELENQRRTKESAADLPPKEQKSDADYTKEAQARARKADAETNDSAKIKALADLVNKPGFKRQPMTFGRNRPRTDYSPPLKSAPPSSAPPPKIYHPMPRIAPSALVSR